ncbi:MAG: ArnT family glycosyltransferase [Nannocystaceae bacterium]|nr:phospholipid carrier-dependent glycosyltransferase [bacterium]
MRDVPGWVRKLGPLLGGLLIALVVTTALSVSHRSTGYVRDEGIYFQASRSYAAWVDRLVRQPGKALRRELRDRHFAPNHEHPALMKTLGGLSARWVGSAPAQEDRPARTGLMPEGAAMRLPAQLAAGIGCALLFLAGFRRAGVLAGMLAAGCFILLPRVWFNAGLHAFDVPVATAILAVVLAYRRAQSSALWGVLVGVLLGIAIAVKHNALFVGPLLATHHGLQLLLDRARSGRVAPRSSWIPLPLVSMMVLAPLVAWLCWPWMWADTLPRLQEYFDFHRQHSWYNMEFLGRNYNQPPMPIGYPLVMTLATVPAVLLVTGAVGLLVQGRDDVFARADGHANASFWTPRPASLPPRDALLYGLFAAFPIALISLPSTPIFGGTKHWITAYPFLALLCAEAWCRLWRLANLPHARRRWMQPALVVALLAPGAVAIRDAPTLGLSQYAPLAGGPRGAARLGLNRGFWGHAISGVLPEGPSRIHLHDLHELARRQYAREGRWPQNLEPAPLRRAEAALLFHELHMTTHEVDAWNRFGTTAPQVVLELDDVPLTSLYAAPQ